MEQGIKVLMISRDRNIANPGNAVAERMEEYGKLVEELHIVIFALKNLKLEKKQIASNVWIYPTNSFSRWLYIRDAARLGKQIVFDKKFTRGKSLVTTQDPFESGWAGLKVKKKWRIPLEVQMHTDPFSPYFSGFQNRVRKFFARKVLHNADSIRVVTKDLKPKILNLPAGRAGLKSNARISVLPIYVDKEKIKNAKISFDLHARYPWRFILLTVSRLSPEKNLELALETLALVRERFLNTGLVIVGSGPEESKLRSMVKSLRLEGAVEFVGWQNDLTSFYKTANVFIQTSLFEGYGLSLVEAGLSGLPVITTPVGVALELEHDKDALIYPLNDVNLFANGVIDLIENNYKRENLRANMKRTLETKLISKDDYMAQIKLGWEETARNIK
ncbi:MAG: glycosyltransferase [Candidatus Zambryskibacteria bacterium]|nr:glycosyltransferase [Candidatus Zambryskibacteria bacterium]